MTQGLDIAEVVNINTTISSGGIGPADFGTGLLLMHDKDNTEVLDTSGPGKIKKFASQEEVDNAFQDNVEVKRETAIWFSADPSPKSLYLARIIPDDIATVIWSKKLGSDDLNALGNISNGSFRINNHDVTNFNPSTNSGNAIANSLKAQMRQVTEFSTTEVAYIGGRIKITLGGASNAKITTTPVITNASAGAPIGVLLGFVQSGTSPVFLENGDSSYAGGYYRLGHTAEGVDDALNGSIQYATGGRPNLIMLSGTVPSTISLSGTDENSIGALRTFIGTGDGDYIGAFVESSTFAGTTDNVSSGSQIKLANDANNKNVIGIYAEDSDTGTSNRKVDIALLAKLSSQDFDQPQSIITLVPKPLSGVVPSNITSTRIEVLGGINGSTYTKIAGYDSFLGGNVGDGTWIDAQYWLTWLKNEMERNLFNAMRQSKRFDNIELTDTVHKVMAKAINTGGVKLGGIVNTAIKKEIRIITNNHGFDGVLQNGYLLYITPDSSLTDIDRADRNQTFKVWISPSDAIHSVGGTIVLSG